MNGDGLMRGLLAEKYTRESLAKIKEVLEAHRTHEILPVANGLYAASSGQEPDSVTGYQHVWVRDNVMVANSFRLRGKMQPAMACMEGLSRFFETQRGRFREIIEDPTRTLKEAVNRRPHIRFTAQTLGELPERWPHAQNDALGAALWLRFVLANSGALPLTEKDGEVYGLFPEYFEAIEYWRDKDSGAWEETRKTNSSSVGAVVAGLAEMRRYAGGATAAGMRPDGIPRDEKLEALIAKGRERLAATLPFEAPPERKADAALLLLIHPLGAIDSRAMQDAILKLVQTRLEGEAGIKRYEGDSYFCQDYDEILAPEERSSDFSERLESRDAFLKPGCEAQWCIFDPLLSIIYGERFLKDPSDLESAAKQIHYFNRSLQQITTEGKCPELYFLKKGKYVANVHTPLGWTQANQALALHLVEQSIEVRK